MRKVIYPWGISKVLLNSSIFSFEFEKLSVSDTSSSGLNNNFSLQYFRCEVSSSTGPSSSTAPTGLLTFTKQ